MANLDQTAIGKMPDELGFEPRINPENFRGCVSVTPRGTNLRFQIRDFRFKRNVQNLTAITRPREQLAGKITVESGESGATMMLSVRLTGYGYGANNLS